MIGKPLAISLKKQLTDQISGNATQKLLDILIQQNLLLVNMVVIQVLLPLLKSLILNARFDFGEMNLRDIEKGN